MYAATKRMVWWVCIYVCVCVHANVFKNWDNMFCYPMKYLNFFNHHHISLIRAMTQNFPTFTSITKYTRCNLYKNFVCVPFSSQNEIFSIYSTVLSSRFDEHIAVSAHSHTHTYSLGEFLFNAILTWILRKAKKLASAPQTSRIHNFWLKNIYGRGFYPISQMFSLSLGVHLFLQPSSLLSSSILTWKWIHLIRFFFIAIYMTFGMNMHS